MANFNYRRFFVILRAKDTGFELYEKEPSGYCKIDIKNNRIRFYIYVQDLKPQAAEQGIYEAYIVSPREEKPAQKLVDIVVDNRGKAECSFESDTVTLNRTVKSLEEFSAIAVVCKSYKHTGKLYYPLVGSAGKRIEIDWSGHIMAEILKISKTELYKQQITDKVEVLNNTIPEKLEFPEEVMSRKAAEPEKSTAEAKALFEEETVSKQMDITNDEAIFRKTESDVEIKPEEPAKLDETIPLDETISTEGEVLQHGNMLSSNNLNSNMDTGQNEDLEISEIESSQTALNEQLNNIGLESGGENEESDSKEIIVEKIETHDKIAFEDNENPDDKTDEAVCLPFSSTNYWDVMRDYFIKISNENPRIYPFGYNDERRWVKVEHISDGHSKHCDSMAYMDFHFSDPLIRDPKSLAHYLVGLLGQPENISYVIYGFPGYSYEQPPAYAIHGLSVWEPLKNGYGKGYWLIYIDAQTGDLVQRP